jgi:hypothetical protein
MTRRLAVVVVALAFVVSGCGGGEGVGGGTEPQDQAGCDSLVETPTEEMFVLKLFDCTTGGEKTKVYTFNDSAARDNWRKAGEQFGAVVLDSGDRWLKVKR